MLQQLRETYWQIRKEPNEWAQIMLSTVNPHTRAERKYASELNYWRRELNNLQMWFIDRKKDWWGVPPPTLDEGRGEKYAELWSTNAIMHLHRVNPHLLEELQVDADTFAGQRILEVGCGPLLPILQFVNCERHGVDPLMTAFAEAGWPTYGLDARMQNGYGERLPYPDNYFDGVISRNALDHVDDVGAVAAEIGRVLKPGGRFLCAVDYHLPTREEPHQLDDNAMIKLFSMLDMKKVSDRSKSEIHADLARRFGLSLAALNRRSNPEDLNRYTAWHGSK